MSFRLHKSGIQPPRTDRKLSRAIMNETVRRSHEHNLRLSKSKLFTANRLSQTAEDRAGSARRAVILTDEDIAATSARVALAANEIAAAQPATAAVLKYKKVVAKLQGLLSDPVNKESWGKGQSPSLSVMISGGSVGVMAVTESQLEEKLVKAEDLLAKHRGKLAQLQKYKKTKSEKEREGVVLARQRVREVETLDQREKEAERLRDEVDVLTANMVVVREGLRRLESVVQGVSGDLGALGGTFTTIGGQIATMDERIGSLVDAQRETRGELSRVKSSGTGRQASMVMSNYKFQLRTSASLQQAREDTFAADLRHCEEIRGVCSRLSVLESNPDENLPTIDVDSLLSPAKSPFNTTAAFELREKFAEARFPSAQLSPISNLPFASLTLASSDSDQILQEQFASGELSHDAHQDVIQHKRNLAAEERADCEQRNTNGFNAKLASEEIRSNLSNRSSSNSNSNSVSNLSSVGTDNYLSPMSQPTSSLMSACPPALSSAQARPPARKDEQRYEDDEDSEEETLLEPVKKNNKPRFPNRSPFRNLTNPPVRNTG